MCSIHNRPGLNTAVSVVSEMDGSKGTVSSVAEEADNAGGTLGTRHCDCLNGSVPAAADGGDRVDVTMAKKVDDLESLEGENVADLEKNAAVGDGLVRGRSDGGLLSAGDDLAIGVPPGSSVMAELADDLEMVGLCGNS